jgi:alcohol dehydrogenase
MRAAIYHDFRAPLSVAEVSDPAAPAGGVVLKVMATGVCRSDWHGWMGHDRDIRLPHVPGHEIAGEIVEVGAGVRTFSRGDRVTLPFVCGCGSCEQCASGNQQVCDHQFQPGFTHWGSYAEYVAIHFADENLVRLPESIDYVTAASLGCRFATAFRAVVAQGQLQRGQWVAVHGCGGVGLSAIMIAAALGARVVAIDVSEDALALAATVGAEICIGANEADNFVRRIRDVTDGGAHVSLDAFGSGATCVNSIACLRKRGKHIQVGLMAGADRNATLPMAAIIANELEVIGSHGMQASRYDEMLDMIVAGQLNPSVLVQRTVNLDQAASELGNEHIGSPLGVTIIDRFTNA